MHLRVALVAIAVSAVAAGTVAAAGPAQAAFSSTAICYNNHCWNNWNGNTGLGNQIKFYNYNSGTIVNSGWQIKFIGYVSESGNVWPFVNGSGQNTRYNGAPVYQMKWNPDQAVCASKGASPASRSTPWAKI